MPEGSNTRAARLPDDLDDEFEAYRDVNDMSNSEALRELVRTGIEQKKRHPLDERPSTKLAGLLWDARRDIHTFVLVALVALTASFLTTGALSWVMLAVSAGYALTVVVGAIDALFLDRGVTLWLSGYGTAEDGDEVAQ